MQMAWVVSQRGTCSRLQVGCVFSRDGRVITIGYNGAPAGMPHCNHDHDQIPHITLPNSPILGYGDDNRLQAIIMPEPFERSEDWVAKPGQIIETPDLVITDPGCQIAEHAERNAIAFAARHGLALDGSEIHVTHAPCLACSRTVINAGVKRVTYEIPYRLTQGVELLEAAGIKVIQMDTGHLASAPGMIG